MINQMETHREDLTEGTGKMEKYFSDVPTGVWFVTFYGIYSFVFIVEQDVPGVSDVHDDTVACHLERWRCCSEHQCG